MGVKAQQSGSLKNLKQQLKKGSGGSFIQYIPKNGSRTVRFLEEPEKWVMYTEVWDEVARKSYPLPEDPTAEQSEMRQSTVYLASAVDRDTDKVIPLQLKRSAVNKLVRKYDRYETILDRDYEISRFGEGLETEYDVETGSTGKINVAKYKPLDLIATLEAAYKFAVGDDDDDDDEEAPRKRRGKKAAPKKPSKEWDDDEDDDDEDDEDEAPARRKRPAKKAAAKKAPARRRPRRN